MKQILHKKWRIAPSHTAIERKLERELHIHPIVAKLLANRGFETVEDGADFLHPKTEAMLSPFTLKDMDKAVNEIERVIESNDHIVVYGDYDVDGITATSLLYRFLKRCGAKVTYYIPERQSEGYGLNLEALEHIIEMGAALVITVDCGISSADIVAAVKDRISIIITDHHNPPEVTPMAHAVINPKQVHCPYEDKNLSGVGVAFKLCQGVWLRRTGDWYLDDLDIVALGTVADVVPLQGENRIIVREGLEKMNTNPNVGIKSLIAVAGLEGRTITAGHIGFTLAPRLNAAGRVTHATRGVELLTADDTLLAEEIATELQETNLERQRIERGIHEEARLDVSRQGDMADKVLVIAHDNWHPGVIGIVASRLVEEFYKPTLMITVVDGIGKGSCRSIEAFNMYDALHYASDLLVQFGGHQQAAGFSIEAKNIPLLRERLIQYCEEHLTAEDYIPTIDIDTLVTGADVTIPVIEEIAKLEPYGMGNSTPVFALENVVVSDLYLMGQQKNHCKFIFDVAGVPLDGICWQGESYHSSIFPGETVNLAFSLQKNEWNGHVQPQLLVQDIYAIRPQREELTADGLRAMYVVIKNIFRTPTVPKYILETEVIHKHPADQSDKEAMLAIEVFKELGILQEEKNEAGVILYRWIQVGKKLDLVTSLTFLKYSKQEVGL